jgi:hypothetical protein
MRAHSGFLQRQLSVGLADPRRLKAEILLEIVDA